MRAAWAIASLVAGAGLTGCAGPPPTPALPAGAPPSQVLSAYLAALVDEDCASARQLTTSTFVKGSGELCGAVRVTGYRPVEQSGPSGADAVVFSSVLTVENGDVSLPDGPQYWCWVLRRQADGSWRLAEGGRACVP